MNLRPTGKGSHFSFAAGKSPKPLYILALPHSSSPVLEIKYTFSDLLGLDVTFGLDKPLRFQAEWNENTSASTE